MDLMNLDPASKSSLPTTSDQTSGSEYSFPGVPWYGALGSPPLGAAIRGHKPFLDTAQKPHIYMRGLFTMSVLGGKDSKFANALKSICKTTKPDNEFLFGPEVQKTLKQRMDAMKAFKKSTFKASDRRDDKQFFRGSPSAVYGSGMGRNQKPYNITPNRIHPQPQSHRGKWPANPNKPRVFKSFRQDKNIPNQK